MRFSHFLRTQFFDSILVQHASIFASKIHQNRFENRSWKASIFKSILASIFIDFSSILEAHLAPCWQLIRSKWVYAVVSSTLFAWVDVLIRVISRPDPPLAKNVACRPSILNGFRLDFWMFWAPFWKFLVTICPLFGVHFLHNLRINLISFLK